MPANNPPGSGDKSRSVRTSRARHRGDPVHSYQQGRAYLSQQHYPQAVAELTKAIRLDPHNLWAYVARGEAAFCSGDFGQTIADCSHVLRLDGGNLQAWYWRGRALDALGRYDQAIADLTRAIGLHPHHVGA